MPDRLVRSLLFSAFVPAVLFAQVPAGPEFLANEGQWPQIVRHAFRHGGMQTWLTDTGWTTRVEEFVTAPDPGRPGLHQDLPPVRGVALRTTLVGSAGPAAIGHGSPGSARYGFFLGNDPSRWVSQRPGYGAVTYAGMLPGVDLVYRSRNGELHYDVHLAAGVDVGAVRFSVEGHERLEIDADGALCIQTGLGVLRHSAPVAFQEEADGARRIVASAFLLVDGATFGFRVTDCDRSRPLVIDPGIVWSTFLGGTANDFPGFRDCVAVASNGDILTCGSFASATNFPHTPGAYQAGGSLRDGYVTRLDAAGAVVWSAHIGGDNIDRLNGIEELANGDVAFAGWSMSSSWPTTPGAFQTVFGGARDGVLGVLHASGVALLWSTYVGGTAEDYLVSVEQHPAGLIYTCGASLSSDFPVAGSPAQPQRATDVCSMNPDGTLSAFDPQGALVAGTYWGGGCTDYFEHLAFDGLEVVTSGGTSSTNLPVSPNAYQATFGGGTGDGLIARFDAGLTTMTYSSYFGGALGEDARIASDRNGRIVVTGWTSSPLPTTPGAPFPTQRGGSDCYVGVLDTTLPPAQQLRFLTYLGGSLDDGVNGVAVEPSGFITITGSVQSANFPTTAGAYLPAMAGGGWDAFVVRLDPWPGTQVPLVYSSYLGGSASFDYGYGCAIGPSGDAVVAVNAGSANYPVLAPSPAFAGGQSDSAITRLEILPNNVLRYGAPSPACHGPLYLGVNVQPVPGRTTFEVHANGAPAATFGFWAFSPPVATPLSLAGIDVWVGVPTILVSTMSDARGFARLPLPIPLGFTWPFGAFQTAWLPAAGCAPIVASDALR